MTMRGRPPTPMSERIAALTGVSAAGVQPTPLVNVNPFDKDEDFEAWKLWEYVVPELIEHYSVGIGDQPLVEGMCRYYQRWILARMDYAGQLTVMDGMGTLRKHPAVGIEDSSWKEFCECAKHLGLTPLARQRIKPLKMAEAGADKPFSILSFSRDRQKGPPPPAGTAGANDAG